MQINLAPDLSLLAIMVIFTLNYLVVRKFFLKPINDVLEARESETRSAEKLYEDALGRLSEATAQTEAQLQAAKREAAALRERHRNEAGAFRQQLVEKTNAEARTVVADADQRLSGDVATAREQIVRDSESLARLAAERILGRAV
jgi:F-type H+-transporting ATPase subunit b